ncbi:MAG: hypothetical protein PGN15_01660 [Aeromicrobium erythreum]
MRTPSRPEIGHGVEQGRQVVPGVAVAAERVRDEPDWYARGPQIGDDVEHGRVGSQTRLQPGDESLRLDLDAVGAQPLGEPGLEAVVVEPSLLVVDEELSGLRVTATEQAQQEGRGHH